MYDWVPVVFIAFKAAIFGACMFFAIKWHYDQGKKKGTDTRTLVRQSVMLVAGFVVLLLIVLWLTYTVATQMGMDLSL